MCILNLIFVKNCLVPPTGLAHHALLVFVAGFMVLFLDSQGKGRWEKGGKKSGTEGNAGGQCKLHHHLNPTLILAEIIEQIR